MPENVAFNPNFGNCHHCCVTGEGLSGWSIEGYEKSGNESMLLSTEQVDIVDPQVSASDPSVVYYTTKINLPAGRTV
ncbi:MAG: hypothetical protein RLN94_13335 [Roseovarius sp.]